MTKLSDSDSTPNVQSIVMIVVIMVIAIVIVTSVKGQNMAAMLIYFTELAERVEYGSYAKTIKEAAACHPAGCPYLVNFTLVCLVSLVKQSI